MRDEQIGINSGDILCNQQSIGELTRRINELETYFSASEKQIYERLLVLEEKERARARDKHAVELSLDEISEPVLYKPPREGEYFG